MVLATGGGGDLHEEQTGRQKQWEEDVGGWGGGCFLKTFLSQELYLRYFYDLLPKMNSM
jgi:hypothetical protein